MVKIRLQMLLIINLKRYLYNSQLNFLPFEISGQNFCNKVYNKNEIF